MLTQLSCSVLRITTLVLAVQLTACSTSDDVPRGPEGPYDRRIYRQGVKAAKADLRAGILAFEDIACAEEEGNRILWCYRKLLKDKYGIEYRVIGVSPIWPVDARSAGYKSVVGPVIAQRLGGDWEERIGDEAETFYRKHWSEVAHLYKEDYGKW